MAKASILPLGTSASTNPHFLQSPIATTITAVPLPPLSLAARLRVTMDAAAIPPSVVCLYVRTRAVVGGKNTEFCFLGNTMDFIAGL
jgi:hypothetical protein